VAAGTFTNTLLVKVAGSPLAAEVVALLVSATVEDSRGLSDAFELRFRDPHHVAIEKGGFTIGTAVRLSVLAGDGKTDVLLLAAEVTALEVEQDGTGSWTVVRGYDISHRLLRGRTVATYRTMTVSDIVTKVAQRNGIPIGQVDATRTVFDQLAQPNISDWEFVSDLAFDVGAEAAVVDGKLEFRLPTDASKATASKDADADPCVLEMGKNLVRFRALVTAAQQVASVEVRSWDVTQKKALVASAPADKTRSAQIATTPADVRAPFGNRKLVLTDMSYPTQQACQDAATAVAEQVAGGFAEVEGVAAGNPSLRSGVAVSMANVGKPFEGKYVITCSRHVFTPEDGYQTWVTVSGRQDRTLLGLTRGRGRSDGQFHGTAVGIVTDVADPDKLGRVKVQFPWLDDSYVSDWARTVQQGGASGGGMFSPEVDDEVLVVFDHAGIDHPYVIGGLYNGVDKPSKHDVDHVDSSTGKLNRRSFVSRSGNAVELLDAANGAQGVRLRTGDDKLRIHLDRKGTSVVVHSDGTVVIEASKTISVTAKQGVTVDAGSGALELKGKTVAVTAQQGVKVDGGGGDVAISSNAGIDVKGTKVGLSGQATAELKSSGILTIQGSLVKIN
jgi:phage protein D